MNIFDLWPLYFTLSYVRYTCLRIYVSAEIGISENWGLEESLPFFEQGQGYTAEI